MNIQPRLRSGRGIEPPYPLNDFPADFISRLGKLIIYRLHVASPPRIEGSLWEQMFAECVGGEWVRSVARLDDVKLPNCSWSGKVVSGNPLTASNVRLISGRNNVQYSYKISPNRDTDPDKLGAMVLGIWNARLSQVSARNEHLRTVVLIYSPDYTTFGVFEKETTIFIPSQYTWKWNSNDNLEGYNSLTGAHSFTWQLNGQQFTVITSVPQNRKCFKVKTPPLINESQALASINFDESWITQIEVSGALDPPFVELSDPLSDEAS